MKNKARLHTLIFTLAMLVSVFALSAVPASAAAAHKNAFDVIEPEIYPNNNAFADEIENAIPGSTITLESDISLDEPVVIGEDQLISINLNGHNISAKDTAIINNGFLLICGEGSIFGNGSTTIVNNGTINVEGKNIIFDVNVNAYISNEYIALRKLDGKYYIIDNSDFIFEVEEVDGVKYWSLDGVVFDIKVERDAPQFSKNANGNLLISHDSGETWKEIDEVIPPVENPENPDSTPTPDNPDDILPPSEGGDDVDHPTDDPGVSPEKPEENDSSVNDGSDSSDNAHEKNQESKAEAPKIDSDYVFVIGVCVSFVMIVAIGAIAGLATRRRFF